MCVYMYRVREREREREREIPGRRTKPTGAPTTPSPTSLSWAPRAAARRAPRDETPLNCTTPCPSILYQNILLPTMI